MTEVDQRFFDHWLLAGTPPQMLDGVAYTAHEVRFRPDQVLFSEGDESDGLYLVVEGALKVASSNERGEVAVAIARDNSVVGEMGVLDGEPRAATASGIEPGAAYFVPAEPFLDLLGRSPLVCVRLLAILARKLRETNTSLAEIAGIPSILQAPEQRTRRVGSTEVETYLGNVFACVQTLDREYRAWIGQVTEDGQTLLLPLDPEGEQASVFLWRVRKDTTEFAVMDAPKDARSFQESFLRCLEQREAAARLFKEATSLGHGHAAEQKLQEANRKVVDAERQRGRAQAALQRLQQAD